MNAYANVAKELKNGLEKNSILKKLLSLDVVILFASLGLQLFFWLLNQWVGWIIISDFIGLFHTIFYYTMIVGMVLTLANRKDQMLAAAKNDPKVAPLLEGKSIVKEIVVPGKLVNIVVK